MGWEVSQGLLAPSHARPRRAGRTRLLPVLALAWVPTDRSPSPPLAPVCRRGFPTWFDRTMSVADTDAWKALQAHYDGVSTSSQAPAVFSAFACLARLKTRPRRKIGNARRKCGCPALNPPHGLSGARLQAGSKLSMRTLFDEDPERFAKMRYPQPRGRAPPLRYPAAAPRRRHHRGASLNLAADAAACAPCSLQRGP